MISQGDILYISFDPSKGHEQQGMRPAVVISNNDYNRKTGFRVVFPISSTNRSYSLYVDLDDRTKTQGKVLADQLRVLDINARPHQFVERIPEDILDHLIEIATATVER